MKLDPAIQHALDQTGLPFEIERGSRHAKIVVGGVFAGIMPSDLKGSANPRATKNTIAQIRRAARSLK